MKTISKPYFLTIFLLFLTIIGIYGQRPNPNSEVESILKNFEAKTVDLKTNTATVTVHQDPRIKQLSEIKIAMERKGVFSNRYKIQLYNGSLKNANTIKRKARKYFPKWSSEIIYETPDHKVHIGNFRNKLDADRALIAIRKKFPNALRFQPSQK